MHAEATRGAAPADDARVRVRGDRGLRAPPRPRFRRLWIKTGPWLICCPIWTIDGGVARVYFDSRKTSELAYDTQELARWRECMLQDTSPQQSDPQVSLGGWLLKTPPLPLTSRIVVQRISLSSILIPLGASSNMKS